MESDDLAADLRARCLALPDPPPGAMFDHVYADPDTHLMRQKSEHEAYLASFTDEVSDRGIDGGER